MCDPVTREVIEINEPHFMRGGTYQIGGSTELSLNVTYNYARWYYRDDAFGEEGIRKIYGMTGQESIPLLESAIHSLENLDEDLSDEKRKELEAHDVTGYWLPTRKNAIKPLYQLLAMAKMRPDGVWDGD